ncbi:putative nrps-like enzyme protein [Echria macrotheca]|uniref:Nrps-like enzyme protein n=1 Tax=Echria macrotheca TaxID=438768 RepID=A0AAJ0BFQ3_9PEZI|nr:putative nrps-like enzyme protein [Echria macrotheca]
MASERARILGEEADLIPHMVDRLAREIPDAAFCMLPVTDESQQTSYTTVTYKHLANIVDALSWWIVRHLGHGTTGQHGDNMDVLTYVGPNDVRYPALILACIKTGYTLFTISPRNSQAAHRALFESGNCKHLLTSDPMPPAANSIIEAVHPSVWTIPGMQELMEQQPTQPTPFPFNKTYTSSRHEPPFIIHTSGSTGLPKPLVWTHETLARQIKLSTARPPKGVQSIDQLYYDARAISSFPAFHGAGICQYLLSAVALGSTVVIPASQGITTAQDVAAALREVPCDVGVLVPSIVAELAQNEQLLDFFAERLKAIFYLGGDIPTAVGDRVASKIRLHSQWGASEVGIPQQIVPPELDGGSGCWRYIRLHPVAGAAFEEVSDGLYELTIQKQEDPTAQPAFTIRGHDDPGRTEYRTKDLFERHPTVPDAWAWKARADDIIVFLNGEKTNPISMEHHVVTQNAGIISGALVIGAQRFQAALIIDPAAPTTTTAEQAALIESVWPSVEEANRVAPAHARVEKSMILVADPKRPLIRAAKGTIMRAASAAQYAAEIDKLYSDAELGVLEEDEGFVPVGTTDVMAVKSLIKDRVVSIVGEQKGGSLDESTSFFDLGMDSLQALQLVRALRRGLYLPGLALSTIYGNPTISKLTNAVTTVTDVPEDRLEAVLASYTNLVEQIPVPAETPSATLPFDVLLTGTTGSLGAALLSSLLSVPETQIGYIYCLNRRPDGGKAATMARLSSHPNLDRVSFLHADLSTSALPDLARALAARPNPLLVIHNAWPVNFHLPLSAFRPALSGVVNLLSLCARIEKSTCVCFVSSVGVTLGLERGPAPERTLTLDDMTGYSQSKYIAERLCEAAARRFGRVVDVRVLRVGQVAGPAERERVLSTWNASEWLPSLVVSSVSVLGCVPDDLGRFGKVDWIPVDYLGDVLVELSLARYRTQGERSVSVFNVRNPQTADWRSLVEAIVAAAAGERGKKDVKLVSSAEWLARLEESIDEPGQNPAAKLVEFYRHGLWGPSDATRGGELMAVDEAVAASPKLRTMPPVRPEWMRRWVEEWIAEKEEGAGH